MMDLGRRPLLIFLLIVTSAIGLLPVAPTAAFQAATPEASLGASPEPAADVYTDPAGTFTVPIPPNWTVEPRDGYVQLADPDDQIRISIAVLANPDPQAAIADAWAMVTPGVEREPIDQTEIPSPQGVERSVLIVFDDGISSGRIVQALGQLVGDTSYVILADAAAAAATRRQSQIEVILTGFAITTVEATNLAGIAPATLTPELLAQLESFINTEMEAFGIPGMAIVIVQDGAVVYRQGFGVRALGGDEPITPETLMMIGSTTKPMTTMMMGTLVDDGLMAWDTPVVDILPSFAVADPDITQALTMRNLVCACTGVPRRDLELIFNAADLDATDVIASLANFEFFTPVGEAFQYSNQMVVAGGYIATLAAGGTLGDLRDAYVRVMQERVLTPIGMPNTVFSVAEAVAQPNHAAPHLYQLDGSLVPEDPAFEALLAPGLPAGGSTWSNVDDMSRFMLTAMNMGTSPDGKQVISAANLAETMRPQIAVGADTSYGLGWFIDDYKGQPVIDHGGNTLGFTSELAFLPEANLGVVTLTNAQGANVFTNAVRTRLWELAFDQESEIDELVTFTLARQETRLAETAAAIGPAPTQADVAPYLGDFTNAALGNLTVRFTSGRLLLDAGEFVAEARTTSGELAGVSDYVLIDGPLPGLQFNFRDENGSPTVELIDLTGTGSYVFVVPGTGPGATPLATPLATPPAAPSASPLAAPAS